MFFPARLRLAPTTSSAVSWTVLHIVTSLGMTGMERAKRAVWTRVGHVPALIDRAPARVIDTPRWGSPCLRAVYNTPEKFLSKIMPVRYQLRIEINPYL